MRSILLIILVTTLPVATALRATRQDPDWPERLGVPLESVVPIGVEPDTQLLELVAAHVGLAPDALSSARLFRARAVHPESGAAEDVHAGVVPVPALGADGELLFAATPEGELLYVSAWGSEALDTDPDARWGLFLGQFNTVGRVAADELVPQQLDATTALEALLEEERTREADNDDARLAAFLVEQRSAMHTNVQLQRWLNLNAGQRAPDPAWLAAQRARFGSLGEHAPALEPFLGPDGVATWQRVAGELGDALALIEEQAATAELEPLADAGRRLGRRCSSCHNATSDLSEEGFEASCVELRAGLELTPAPFRVGVGCAPALGDDGALSQALATSLQAGLTLAQELDRDR